MLLSGLHALKCARFYLYTQWVSPWLVVLPAFCFHSVISHLHCDFRLEGFGQVMSVDSSGFLKASRFHCTLASRMIFFLMYEEISKV